MSNLAFRMLRMGHPNPIAEFNWPVGKEMASDVRRLTVNEFHLALQLAAKCVREMKGDTIDYKEKYESLLTSFQRYIQKQSFENLQEQIATVNEEIALIKGLLDAPVAEPEAAPAANPAPMQKKRGRPKKVN